jgi:UDP-N-acetylmuramoylalanine--D-glutamate ligase
VRKDSNIVLELSSFQLGGIRDKSYSPKVAVFTNFMDDHMNYYKTLDDYFEDKAVIFMYQREGDVLVVNRENAVIDKIKPNRGVRVISFGIGEEFEGEGSFMRGNDIYYRCDGEELRIMGRDAVRVPGLHNLYNALAAVSTAMALGLKPEAIESGVRAFRGLEHRLEYVASKGGVQFYNDSAATTPDAAIAGIMSMNGSITLIAGGHDKGLALKGFIEMISHHVKNLILLEGTGTRRFINEARGLNYTLFSNLKDAVYHAFRVTEPGGKVLLSPGFASFGMFSNEFERGRMFKEIVLSL